MIDRWNKKWELYVKKEKTRWSLHLPDEMCEFLENIRYRESYYYTYEHYDVYAVDFIIDSERYSLIIETRFPSVLDWTIKNKEVYTKFQSFFSLSNTEYHCVMKVFNQFGILKWIYDTSK